MKLSGYDPLNKNKNIYENYLEKIGNKIK